MKLWPLVGLGALLLSSPAPTHAQTWQPAGVGDCNDHDFAFSPGGVSAPEPGQCNSKTKGFTAVCWDGNVHRHPSGRRFCAYKDIAPQACTGGGSTGSKWECAP
jgi:hypothetical protein